MLAIWSLVPLPFLNPAWTSGSSLFTYCWNLAWRILSITLLACEMSAICGSLNSLCHCLSVGLEWRLTFSSPVATAGFSKFAVSLEWLWAACILKLRAMFLCCWRICVVCLALELVGPWVVLGFSVGVEAFDELLPINVPWSQEFFGVLRVWT